MKGSQRESPEALMALEKGPRLLRLLLSRLLTQLGGPCLALAPLLHPQPILHRPGPPRKGYGHAVCFSSKCACVCVACLSSCDPAQSLLDPDKSSSCLQTVITASLLRCGPRGPPLLHQVLLICSPCPSLYFHCCLCWLPLWERESMLYTSFT